MAPSGLKGTTQLTLGPLGLHYLGLWMWDFQVCEVKLADFGLAQCSVERGRDMAPWRELAVIFLLLRACLILDHFGIDFANIFCPYFEHQTSVVWTFWGPPTGLSEELTSYTFWCIGLQETFEHLPPLADRRAAAERFKQQALPKDVMAKDR